MMKWKVTKGPRCASADRSSDYLRKVEDLPDPNNRSRSTFSSSDYNNSASTVCGKANGGNSGVNGGQQAKADRDIVPLSENRKRSQQQNNAETSRKSSLFVTTDCINLKGIFGISKDRCETPYRSLAALDNGRRRSRSEARGTSIDRLTVAYHATPLIGPQHYIPGLQQQNGNCKTSSSSTKKPRSSSPGEKSGCWVRGRRRERDTRDNETEGKPCRRTISDSCNKKFLNSSKLSNGRTVTDSSGNNGKNPELSKNQEVVAAPVCTESESKPALADGKENVEINNNDEHHRCHQQLLKEDVVTTASMNTATNSASTAVMTEAIIPLSKTVENKPKKIRKKRIAPKPQRVSFADENDDKRSIEKNAADTVIDINDHTKIASSSSSDSTTSSPQAERMATNGADCSGESPANEQPLSITSDISEMECQDNDATQQPMSIFAEIHNDVGQHAEVTKEGDQKSVEDFCKNVEVPQVENHVEQTDRMTVEYGSERDPTDPPHSGSNRVSEAARHNEQEHNSISEVEVIFPPDNKENHVDPPIDTLATRERNQEEVLEIKEITFSNSLIPYNEVEIEDNTSENKDAVRSTNSIAGNDIDAVDKVMHDTHSSFDCVSESNTDDARTDLDEILDTADSICSDVRNSGRTSQIDSGDFMSAQEKCPSQNSESPEPPPRKRTTTSNHSMRVNVVVKSPRDVTEEINDVSSAGFVVKKSFVLTVAKQEEGFRSLCARKDNIPICEEPEDKKTILSASATPQISVTFLCAAPKNGSNGLVDPESAARLRSMSVPPTNGITDTLTSSGPSSSHRSFSKDRRPKDRQSAKRKSHRSRKKENPFNSMPQAVIDELAQVLEHRKRIPNTEAR